MSILLIIFTVLVILSAIFIYGMYFSKNPKIKNISTILAVALNFVIGYIHFDSFPTNAVVQKVITLVISFAIPIVAIVLYFVKKLNISIFKMIIAASLVGANLYLFFS